MTKLSPDVEKSGFVWPSLNWPYVGSPYAPQPRLLVASSRIRANPIGFRGQPSACASGFHIARTSGVRTSAGLAAGAHSASVRWLSSRPQRPDAGDQIVGLSVFAAIFASASPDETPSATISTGRPSSSWSDLLNVSMSGRSSSSWFVEYANATRIGLPRDPPPP